MSKSRIRRVSRKPLYIILGISLVVAASFVFWKNYLRPTLEPVNIMAIEPVPLTYGNTTLSGGLHKDLDDNFILILPDRQKVILNVKGLESIVDSPVTITGYLAPSSQNSPMTMTVGSITVTRE